MRPADPPRTEGFNARNAGTHQGRRACFFDVMSENVMLTTASLFRRESERVAFNNGLKGRYQNDTPLA